MRWATRRTGAVRTRTERMTSADDPLDRGGWHLCYLCDDFFVFLGHNNPMRVSSTSFVRFLDHNDTPQSAGLLWTRDLPVAGSCTWQHTTQQTSIPPVGFQPAVTGSELPRILALDRSTTAAVCRLEMFGAFLVKVGHITVLCARGISKTPLHHSFLPVF
jgi:hypothetical protein